MYEDLLLQLQDSEDESDRINAAKSLRHYESAQTIVALTQALGDPEAVVVGEVMQTLKSFQRDKVLPNLINRANDFNEAIRWSIAELLVDFPSPMSEETLSKLLDDSSSNVQGAAARSLKQMPVKIQTVEKLKSFLEHSQPFPRYEALKTLRVFLSGEIDDATVVLRDLHSSELSNKRAALNYIRELDDKRWIATVEAFVSDSEPTIRKTAQWVLSRLKR